MYVQTNYFLFTFTKEYGIPLKRTLTEIFCETASCEYIARFASDHQQEVKMEDSVEGSVLLPQ